MPARPGFSPEHWAVIGASGFIGGAVVTELKALGMDVAELSAPRLSLDPATADGAEVALLAERHPAVVALASQLKGIEVVINAAGLATPDAPANDELYGANALLPAVVAWAAIQAGVPRVLHLSSAAVQGRRAILDETAEVEPFSPYSRAKALGELGILVIAEERREVEPATDLVVVRATSVQGSGRHTTDSLRRIARSPLASVAYPGDQPTVVSSVGGLARFVGDLGRCTEASTTIRMQPWEGLSVADVLRLAGGREPRRLPRWLCGSLLAVGRSLGAIMPEVAGLVRRIELMWLGQKQVTDRRTNGSEAGLESVLSGRGS